VNAWVKGFQSNKMTAFERLVLFSIGLQLNLREPREGVKNHASLICALRFEINAPEVLAA
jgi:hypothetical protein